MNRPILTAADAATADRLLAVAWSPAAEWTSCAADILDGRYRIDRGRKLLVWRAADRWCWIAVSATGQRIAFGVMSNATTAEMAAEHAVGVDIDARRENGIHEVCS